MKAPSPKLRLWCFEPESYGEQWFVMAPSRAAAIKAVKEYERTKGVYSPGGCLASWPGQEPAEAEKRRLESVASKLATIDAYAAGDPEQGSLRSVAALSVIATEVA